jgi:hypothetical protein
MPGGETFDDGTGEELQGLQGRDVFGLEDVAEGSHCRNDEAGLGEEAVDFAAVEAAEKNDHAVLNFKASSKVTQTAAVISWMAAHGDDLWQIDQRRGGFDSGQHLADSFLQLRIARRLDILQESLRDLDIHRLVCRRL